MEYLINKIKIVNKKIISVSGTIFLPNDKDQLMETYVSFDDTKKSSVVNNILYGKEDYYVKNSNGVFLPVYIVISKTRYYLRLDTNEIEEDDLGELM